MKKRDRVVNYELVQEAYICCEGYEFRWDKKDLPKFIDLWNEGLSVSEISQAFNRKEQEVLFLIVDLDDKKKLRRREGGIWGRELAT